MSKEKLRFETKQIHGGYHVDATGSRGIAIYPTAAYHFKSCDYAAKLFELSEGGNIYTRLHNPTTAAYEERVAALYNAVGALAVSSGMSSILLTVTALAQAGDNIVASPFLYGGTYNQFRISLRKLGIDCRIAKSEKAEDFEALIDDRTKMIYAESMGNPTCDVPDLEALAEVAKRKDVPFVVDNTFGAAGYLCNPFEWGANIVVDSATKWINGHGTAMGGIIVDGGNYNWANGKFPQIDGPSEGYHGLNLYEAFGSAAFVVKCRVDGLRDFGCCPSPFDAYLMLVGLETLSLRVKHQVESAWKLAEFCRQLSGLVASGVGLVRGLEIVSQEEGLDETFRNLCGVLVSKVRSGVPLSQAMEDQMVFPTLMLGMILLSAGILFLLKFLGVL